MAYVNDVAMSADPLMTLGISREAVYQCGWRVAGGNPPPPPPPVCNINDVLINGVKR